MQATIGITAGDPAGIGLEVILKAISVVLPSARWVVFTDRSIFERNTSRFHAAVKWRWIQDLSALTSEPVLFAKDLGTDSSGIEWGELSAEAGKRGLAYLEAASREALSGRIQAIVTAPVSKEAIGSGFRGQTDFLAQRAGCADYAMSFFAPSFKVVLATIHVSLRDALSQISTAHYLRLIRFVDGELQRFKFAQRRIAVAAINPHAGESGMFGREEIDVLAPAIRRCAAEGIRVSGPHSADSLYFRAHSGEFDVVIAPYHDQGLIPIKLIAHGEATNVTLGLPYVRTSPDHGTAFSIAGKGEADPSGMEQALRCAVDLVKRALL
ncbi:MAG: 4-hydroxythreonine-4-phosphate dehydrogenase PdxA [Acidobacteria bacterium]|nr:MAG: 4-hydroxythreonine-4-phosphate dehydrogenase PdxA [Acidobacteriota bacterium]